MNSVYCVCTTPDVYPAYENNWKNFTKDIVWVTDNSKNENFNLGFTYTEKKLREQLDFTGEVSKRHYWNSNGNRNIIWFYAHFRMLNYYTQNPNYDYYWFFDDDVKVGNWDLFFEGTDKDDSDFLGYIVFKDSNVITQEKIPVIDNRTTSQHMWFERFPGDGDILPDDINEKFGSFFPTNRFSNRAMKKLLEIHEEGLHGYSEGFVPTMLNKYGYTLNTIIKSDNTSDFFDVDQVNIQHKNIKINWEWI
jgi:hypothetical protein